VLQPSPAVPSFIVTVRENPWRIGATFQSGLTSNGAPRPVASASGRVSVTAGGNTAVNLVSLRRIRSRGLAVFTGARLRSLRLVYAAPEPATLNLLAAGSAACLLVGLRARRRERRAAVAAPGAPGSR
jgi:hypothetical protein